MPTDQSGLPVAHKFSEHEVDRVLARAVELDVQNESLISFAQLRDAAAEAGISVGSLERAVRESHARQLLETVQPLSHWGLAVQNIARHRVLAGTLAFAAAVVFTPGDGVVQVALWALPMYAAYKLGLMHVRRRANRREPPDARGALPRGGVSKADVARRDDDVTRGFRLALA